MEFTAQFAPFAQPIYSPEGLKACEAIVCDIPMMQSLDEVNLVGNKFILGEIAGDFGALRKPPPLGFFSAT